MSNIAIKINGLGKRYRLGQTVDFSRTFREVLTAMTRAYGRRAKGLITGSTSAKGGDAEPSDMIWALKDVNIEINEGEVVGVIGRNGAGKSTLLKVLSRITAPTEGEVDLHGRVGSLLEVGTGFHPELTGRENIFLNGSILGMNKAEIEKKFDEIVAFAEIEKFIDTPVKRYSSGMYVRLAFAVAAHLDTEILMVDEVLAVGDADFQKKCLEKMNTVAKAGRTVLFVSHNMSSIRRLCSRVILISDGKVQKDGLPEEIIDSYLFEGDSGSGLPSEKHFDSSEGQRDDFVRLSSVKLVSAEGDVKSGFRIDESFSVQIEYNVLKPMSNFHLYGKVFTSDGLQAFASADWDPGEVVSNEVEPGVYSTSLTFPPHLFNAGLYLFALDGLVPSSRFFFRESNLISWRINPQGGAGGMESLKRRGVFRPVLKWAREKK